MCVLFRIDSHTPSCLSFSSGGFAIKSPNRQFLELDHWLSKLPNGQYRCTTLIGDNFDKKEAVLAMLENHSRVLESVPCEKGGVAQSDAVGFRGSSCGLVCGRLTPQIPRVDLKRTSSTLQNRRKNGNEPGGSNIEA